MNWFTGWCRVEWYHTALFANICLYLWSFVAISNDAVFQKCCLNAIAVGIAGQVCSSADGPDGLGLDLGLLSPSTLGVASSAQVTVTIVDLLCSTTATSVTIIRVAWLTAVAIG